MHVQLSETFLRRNSYALFMSNMELPEQEAGEISRKASIPLCERIYSAKKSYSRK